VDELEQLKKEVDSSFQPEDRALVDDLEKRLRYEIVKEGFTRNSVVEDYTKSLTVRIAAIKEQLSETPDLTEAQRNKLFAEKDECRRFLSHFTSQREQVEKDIKQTLHEAIEQSA
jgi:hypothetical protein